MITILALADSKLEKEGEDRWTLLIESSLAN